MKRVIVVSAIVLCVGAIVGTFIVAGGDGSSAAKSGVTTTAAPDNAVKDGAQAIANAGNQVESLAPAANGNTTTSVKGNSGSGKYEAKQPFIGVAPASVKQFKDVEFQVRNFKPGELVTVTITKVGGGEVLRMTVPADEQGRLKGKIPAPAIGSYDVLAVGAESGASSSTTLQVVPK